MVKVNNFFLVLVSIYLLGCDLEGAKQKQQIQGVVDQYWSINLIDDEIITSDSTIINFHRITFTYKTDTFKRLHFSVFLTQDSTNVFNYLSQQELINSKPYLTYNKETSRYLFVTNQNSNCDYYCRKTNKYVNICDKIDKILNEVINQHYDSEIGIILDSLKSQKYFNSCHD